ncbi:hypothetical protein ACWC5C_35225 [Streptomyces sp. NPDC001700]
MTSPGTGCAPASHWRPEVGGAVVLPYDRAPRGMHLTPGAGSTEERYERLTAWTRQRFPDAAERAWGCPCHGSHFAVGGPNGERRR